MDHAHPIPPAPPAPDGTASQDSLVSLDSTFSAPAVPRSASNLSTSTAEDHDAAANHASHATHAGPLAESSPKPHPSPAAQRTSPPSNISPTSRISSRASPTSRTSPTPRISPTPHISPTSRISPTRISPASRASPTSPASNKRKAQGSFHDTDTPPVRAVAHKRTKSMDAHSSSRIGELSAQLKTRLSYAMVKVQNGWEKQSLDELEEVHSQRGSPNSAPGGPRLVFESPSAADRRRRPSDMSDHADSLQSRTTPASYWRTGARPAISAAVDLISVTNSTTRPGLASTPEFDVGRRRRSSTIHAPPTLLGFGPKKYHSDLSDGPRVPATPRAGILRMPSQQAEKDAVDTLLFMSSPNNSQRFAHTHAQAAPTPLRTDGGQRRVMFDTYSPQERHTPMPAPSHYQYGPYAAHPAR